MRLAERSSSLGLAGLRHEDSAAAGRFPRAFRVVGTDDGDRVDRRLDPRMPIRIEMRLVRLACGLEERRRGLQKCRTERVRTRAHRDADLEVLVDRVVRGLIIVGKLWPRSGGFTVNNCTRSRSSSNSRSCGSFRPSICSSRFRVSRIWISYSPSSGNVYRTTAPPRVPIGRPSRCSSCVRSGGILIGIAARRAAGTSDGQAADLLRR